MGKIRCVIITTVDGHQTIFYLFIYCANRDFDMVKEKFVLETQI